MKLFVGISVKLRGGKTSTWSLRPTALMQLQKVLQRVHRNKDIFIQSLSAPQNVSNGTGRDLQGLIINQLITANLAYNPFYAPIKRTQFIKTDLCMLHFLFLRTGWTDICNAHGKILPSLSSAVVILCPFPIFCRYSNTYPISRKICRNWLRTFSSGWRWPLSGMMPRASKLQALNFRSLQEPLQIQGGSRGKS